MGLLDVDVDDLEGRPQEHEQARVVVDEQDPKRARPGNGDFDRGRGLLAGRRTLLARGDDPCGEDLVAPRILGLVERGVRAGEQLLFRLDPRRLGDTAGEGGQVSSPALEPSSLQDALARAHARFRGAREDDGELVAADSIHVLVCAHGPQEDACERCEHFVPGGVAAGVVDGLEAVHVEQRDSDGVVAVLLEQPVELLVEGAAVGEAGEGIAPRLRERERESALLGERRRGEVGDRADELLVELELNARRHRNEQRAEAGPVSHQRNGQRVAAGDAEPVELGKLVGVGRRGNGLRERAQGDARRAREPVARRGAGDPGQREPGVGGGQVRSRAESARQLDELPREQLADPAGEGAAERVGEADERLAGAGDRALELPERRALDAVRARAGLEHLLDDLQVVRAGERDHARARDELADAAGGLDPVHDGHRDVHQDDVGHQVDAERDRLAAVGGLADDLEVPALGEHRAQHPARLVRVIADQYADHSVHTLRFSHSTSGSGIGRWDGPLYGNVRRGSRRFDYAKYLEIDLKGGGKDPS